MGATPQTIIIDQDVAMKVAICSIFPDTFHRFCKWHMTHKMGDKINTVYRNKKVISDFFDLLNHSSSTSEFEARLVTWIVDNKLGGNVWLKDIYAI